MTSVPGASLYRNAALVANTRGLPPSTPGLLDTGVTTASVLQASRNLLSTRGIGLSNNARALTEEFLGRTADVNKLFSLSAGPDATQEGLKQQILAIRAGLPDSQLARSLRGGAVDTEA